MEIKPSSRRVTLGEKFSRLFQFAIRKRRLDDATEKGEKGSSEGYGERKTPGEEFSLSLSLSRETVLSP